MRIQAVTGYAALFILTLFCYSCVSTQSNQSLDHKSSNKKGPARENTLDYQGNKSSLPGTAGSQIRGTSNIYRHLTSVSDYYPSARDVQDLCIRSQEFHVSLPGERVLSSRELRIPVSHLETRYEQIEVERYKVIAHEQDEVVYGVVVGKIRKEEEIPYKETVEREVKMITSGVCVGSEYILSED